MVAACVKAIFDLPTAAACQRVGDVHKAAFDYGSYVHYEAALDMFQMLSADVPFPAAGRALPHGHSPSADVHRAEDALLEAEAGPSQIHHNHSGL